MIPLGPGFFLPVDQLGIGTHSGPETCVFGIVCSTRPVAASGIADATALTAGHEHTCALRGDGSVWCWGNGFNGQLGNGGFEALARTGRTPSPGVMVTSGMA